MYLGHDSAKSKQMSIWKCQKTIALTLQRIGDGTLGFREVTHLLSVFYSCVPFCGFVGKSH